MVPRLRSSAVRLLAAANWILLGVSWGMSIYSYVRLPRQMAAWLSVWRGGQAVVDKSLAFFALPVFQAVFCIGFLVLARRYLSGPAGTSGKRDSRVERSLGRLGDLRQEVASLGLIFINLIFIHLQTSRILVSHRLAAGVNRTYLTILVLILVILFPYYHIRRQILLREES